MRLGETSFALSDVTAVTTPPSEGNEGRGAERVAKTGATAKVPRPRGSIGATAANPRPQEPAHQEQALALP